MEELAMQRRIALSGGRSVKIKPTALQLLTQGVYNPSPEETVADVERLYESLCDLLLPAFMSDKPYTVGRARIEKALEEKTYMDRPLVHRILQIANKKPSPYEYVRKLHRKLERTKASALIGSTIAEGRDADIC